MQFGFFKFNFKINAALVKLAVGTSRMTQLASPLPGQVTQCCSRTETPGYRPGPGPTTAIKSQVLTTAHSSQDSLDPEDLVGKKGMDAEAWFSLIIFNIRRKN